MKSLSQRLFHHEDAGAIMVDSSPLLLDLVHGPSIPVLLDL